MLLCKFCNTEKFQKLLSLRNHERGCKFNPNREVLGKPFRDGVPAWNAGLTKDTDARVNAQALSLKSNGKVKGVAATPEQELKRRQKIKEKSKNNGGLRLGSGRGKSGWYKGFYCRSSWELAFVIFHLDHSSNIAPCREVRYYTWKGRVRKYYPDFVLNGQVIEIKGYITDQWRQKHLENPDIVLMTRNELSGVIDYVINKYGRDFVVLYEEKLAESA